MLPRFRRARILCATPQSHGGNITCGLGRSPLPCSSSVVLQYRTLRRRDLPTVRVSTQSSRITITPPRPESHRHRHSRDIFRRRLRTTGIFIRFLNVSRPMVHTLLQKKGQYRPGRETVPYNSRDLPPSIAFFSNCRPGPWTTPKVILYVWHKAMVMT